MTAKFDKEFVTDDAKPLTAAQREAWSAARKKMGRGRPTTGRGSKVISLSIERTLLKQADAFAKREKMSRAALVAKGIKAVLAGAA